MLSQPYSHLILQALYSRVKDSRLYLFLFLFSFLFYFLFIFYIFGLRLGVSVMSHITVTTVTHQVI